MSEIVIFLGLWYPFPSNYFSAPTVRNTPRIEEQQLEAEVRDPQFKYRQSTERKGPKKSHPRVCRKWSRLARTFSVLRKSIITPSTDHRKSVIRPRDHKLLELEYVLFIIILFHLYDCERMRVAGSDHHARIRFVVH
ncbi:hypothetical protein CDAR_485451 [Caerostris darwini]|uniref:Uncharacterized protein n=1 Tax=Caerostris darwini TaxID=1538125 RepID=A0AAV4PE72_9ARAC|nr:hypothetical protein CDAR_485451 [Caerostris darwini]